MRRGMKVGAWVVVVAATSAAVAARPPVALAFFVILLTQLVWRWPDVALGVIAAGVLAVRPSLDVFGERRLGLGALALNPAVVFGACVLWASVVLAVHRAKMGSKLWPDTSSLRVHLWLFAAYLVGMVSAIRLSGDMGAVTAGREISRVCSIVGGFLVVVWWVGGDPERARRGWALLFLGAVPPLMVAAWQLMTGGGNLELAGVNRLQGTLSHPNSFGVYLVPFVLFLIGGIAGRRAARKAMYLVGALSLCALILLTYSRTALLVLVAGLVALPLLQSKRLGWRALVTTGGLLLALGAIGWVFGGDLIRERFANLSVGRDAWQAAMMGESENSFTWRLINWAVLIQMGAAHPIMGHGAGMTTVLNPLVNPANGVPFNAHNDFVRFFFEGGSLSLACYILYCVLLCKWALKRARRVDVSAAPIAYGVVASLLALTLLSLGTTELSLNTAILYELYAMLALMAVTDLTPGISISLAVGHRTASGQPP